MILFYIVNHLQLNPIVNVFRFIQEQVRAVQALNPLERGVFLFTRQILGNRRARIAFAVYAGALHLLVLVTLYESYGGGAGAVRVPEPPAKIWS